MLSAKQRLPPQPQPQAQPQQPAQSEWAGTGGGEAGEASPPEERMFSTGDLRYPPPPPSHDSHVLEQISCMQR